jgi:hypothetical protein
MVLALHSILRAGKIRACGARSGAKGHKFNKVFEDTGHFLLSFFRGSSEFKGDLEVHGM